MQQRVLRILGTRGVPAAHGGFETFAEQLALYLVARGWRVVVYCQDEGPAALREDRWQGIERVRIAVPGRGASSTILFDWKATLHASSNPDLCLTLGYNTAVFCALLKLRGIRNIINMDGIEWSRAKWGPLARTWFRLNEVAGCRLGDHLVADHPEIELHLRRQARPDRISMIPYGADRISEAPDAPVRALGLQPGRYLTVIARPEPENSILEVVRGFSRRPRGVSLAVLGHYRAEDPFHRAVRMAASDEVLFLGAIYDREVVSALRVHSLAYVHGHQVGGTNPSLVEALGAGNAVIAHDNRFNRWVAGEGARYFQTADEVDALLSDLLLHPARLDAMRAASLRRFDCGLHWSDILASYEALLVRVAQAATPGAEGRPAVRPR